MNLWPLYVLVTASIACTAGGLLLGWWRDLKRTCPRSSSGRPNTMRWWSVQWDADIKAPTAEDAAAQARDMWRNPSQRVLVVKALGADDEPTGEEYTATSGNTERSP